MNYFARIKRQIFGTTSDYVNTRPTAEQVFWHADSPIGLFDSAKRHDQVAALIRYFVVHIGGIWICRISALISAVWLLCYAGFVLSKFV